MIKISSIQISNLAVQSKEEFQVGLGKRLNDRFPRQLNKDEALNMADQAIAKSNSYGINTEKDITYIAERMFTEGLNFEHIQMNKYVLEVLENDSLPGDEKIYEIYKHELELNLLDK
ncbi:MAG: hypothetical protein HRT35_02995 [Algicola sp.]|nr:hypothetical protein [Algicola sp.]